MFFKKTLQNIQIALKLESGFHTITCKALDEPLQTHIIPWLWYAMP